MLVVGVSLQRISVHMQTDFLRPTPETWDCLFNSTDGRLSLPLLLSVPPTVCEPVSLDPGAELI